MIASNINIILLLIAIVVIILSGICYFEFKKLKIDLHTQKENIENISKKFNTYIQFQMSQLSTKIPEENLTFDLQSKEEDKVKEDVLEEDVKEEDVLEEDVKEEDVLEEDVKEEDVKEEDVVELDVVEEDVLELDVKEEDVLEEDVVEEDVKELDVKEEDELLDPVIDDILDDTLSIPDSNVNLDDIIIDREQSELESKSINELKEILKEMDLKTSGNKSKLIERIIDNK